jgi:hypothetical protein
MSWRARLSVLGAVAALVPAASACTSPAPRPALHSSPASGVLATRWWSNSGTESGTKIDAAKPDAIAARLHESQSDYCGMLKQTVAAKKSILPGVTATDPALLTATKAFVAELEAVAPASVSGPWKVLGTAVLAVVESGGDTAKVKGIDATAVQRAATEVAADAKRNCGVDLASVATK